MSAPRWKKKGITIITGNTISKGRQARQGIHGASVQRVEHCFGPGDVRDRAASERRQSGLENAGVAINPENGGIAVDAWSKTSLQNIYAIGDVTHRSQPDAGGDPRGPMPSPTPCSATAP